MVQLYYPAGELFFSAILALWHSIYSPSAVHQLVFNKDLSFVFSSYLIYITARICIDIFLSFHANELPRKICWGNAYLTFFFWGEIGGVKPPTVLLLKSLSATVLRYRNQETKKVTKKIKKITHMLLAMNRLRGDMLILPLVQLKQTLSWRSIVYTNPMDVRKTMHEPSP